MAEKCGRGDAGKDDTKHLKNVVLFQLSTMCPWVCASNIVCYWSCFNYHFAYRILGAFLKDAARLRVWAWHTFIHSFTRSLAHSHKLTLMCVGTIRENDTAGEMFGSWCRSIHQCPHNKYIRHILQTLRMYACSRIFRPPFALSIYHSFVLY